MRGVGKAKANYPKVKTGESGVSRKFGSGFGFASLTQETPNEASPVWWVCTKTVAKG